MRSPRENLENFRGLTLCRFRFMVLAPLRRAIAIPFPVVKNSSIKPVHLFIPYSLKHCPLGDTFVQFSNTKTSAPFAKGQPHGCGELRNGDAFLRSMKPRACRALSLAQGPERGFVRRSPRM